MPGENTKLCPTCTTDMDLQEPQIFQRYYRCRRCWTTFWWDGPSVLGPTDPARKRSYSDRLIPCVMPDI